MARGVISEEFQDASGNVAATVPIDIFEDDGVTPFAGVIFSAKTGGVPVVAPTTNSLGRFTGYVDLADVRPIKVKRTSAAASALVASNAYHDPRDLVNLSTAQTLTSKTLTSPIITTPSISTATLTGTTSAGKINSTPTQKAFEGLPIALADVGIGFSDLTDYTRVGVSEVKGGGALQSATGIYLNTTGSYAPATRAFPASNYLSWVTPDIADTSTSQTETAGNHVFALTRTGAGLITQMAAGTTVTQAVQALTVVVASNGASTADVTVSGITATLNQYVGWHLLSSTGGAYGVTRKVTANTATSAGNTTFTVSGTYAVLPAVGEKATLNYGQTTDYVNVLSTFQDDSTMLSLGGVHTTIGVGSFGRTTASSAGNVVGHFALIYNLSRNGLPVGAEWDVGNYSGFAAPYYASNPTSSVNQILTSILDPTTVASVVNSATATTITVSGTPWTVNSEASRGIRMTSGARSGEEAVVTSNTNNTLTFTPAMTGAPALNDTFMLGSLWGGVALSINAIAGSGFRQGIVFDDDTFSRVGSFGIDFRPQSRASYAIRIPSDNALYAWKTGQTWGGNYPSPTRVLGTAHPHLPLIGTVGNNTYLGTDATMVFTNNTPGVWSTEYARLTSVGLVVGSTGVSAAAQLHARGAGQAVVAYDPTTGNQGGALFLVDSTGGVNNGGFLGLGTAAANAPGVQVGFKAILSDATAYGLAALSIQTRSVAATATLVEHFRIGTDGLLDFRNGQYVAVTGGGVAALGGITGGPAATAQSHWIKIKLGGTGVWLAGWV